MYKLSESQRRSERRYKPEGVRGEKKTMVKKSIELQKQKLPDFDNGAMDKINQSQLSNDGVKSSDLHTTRGKMNENPLFNGEMTSKHAMNLNNSESGRRRMAF